MLDDCIQLFFVMLGKRENNPHHFDKRKECGTNYTFSGTISMEQSEK
jgi:hypothetical protein